MSKLSITGLPGMLCRFVLIASLALGCQSGVWAEASQPKHKATSARSAGHGIGEGYNPESPGNPGAEPTATRYKLITVSNPSGAGLNNTYEVLPEEQVWVYASGNSNNFRFINWTIEGEEISTSESFYYTMPEHDVTLIANYAYDPSNPGNPSPEEQRVSHPVVVRAIPAGAAYFSPGSQFDMEENETRWLYAYPNSGWQLTGWTINGEEIESDGAYMPVSMGEKALDITATFVYNPASPGNPAPNHYNPATGEVVVDDFTPGTLYSVLDGLVGYGNYGNVTSIIVKGEMDQYDVGNLTWFENISLVDISRTGGISQLPSYAFSGSSASEIVLPYTISEIGYRAFNSCENLASLTIYAQAPPVCDASTFSGFTNKDNCTVFVPASAIELYTNADYWKDFTILPITTDAHVLQVNLPEDAADGRYKNNSLEIANLKSGVRHRYVISDRLLYTFNGLQKDEEYNIYMYSQSGIEIGRIENVIIPDEDIEVTFDTLKELYTVVAKVTLPDGSDVTSDVTVEWLMPEADGTATYLRKAVSVSEIPEGQNLLCRIGLDNTLGVRYAVPEDVEYTTSAGENLCEVSLVPFREIALSGTLVDGDGSALSEASVSVNQTLNGKYSKSYSAKTDRKGQWAVSVLDAPSTRITYASADCVNVNDTIGAFGADVTSLDLGKTTMKSIVGARVTYGFTYKEAGVDESQDYYADYQNVAVSVFNIAQDRAHNEVSLQYPILAVLDENINAGDELRLTATSKTGAFNPIVATATVGENQRAEVTFDIIGKGGIEASFEMTGNQSVIAMLYASNGELLKKTAYSEAKARFTGLEDGDYTLVSMGQSNLMNSILKLSNFGEVGLTEGRDYVVNAVTVESGVLSEVCNEEIPEFDETLFYYTGATTNFSANKSSITTGNYLTLRSSIDFKEVYKDGVSNVALVVDLPEACDFVDQSVIQGPNQLPYTIDNNRLTVQLGSNYQSQVRFCVTPTNGGSFNASASVVFDYDGQRVTQPIGSAISEIKDIEITVPSVIAGPVFKVTGTAAAYSEIRIIEDGALLGSGPANAVGSWNVECELNNPYNLSTHQIYAEITTPSGTTLTTETKSLTYDANAVAVSKVTMYHWNPEMRTTYVSEFDFLNPKTTATHWIVYYPKKVFTYTIEFTDNDPERISNVILYVHTADGRFVPCNATFDEEKGLWYADIDMGTSSDSYYPVNCSVDFDYQSEAYIDTEEYNNSINGINLSRADVESTLDELNAIDLKLEEYFDDLSQEADLSALLLESRLISGAGGDVPTDLPVNMTEDEARIYFEKLTEEVSELLSKETYNVFEEAFAQSLNEVANQMEGVTVITCDGLVPSQLLEEGYTEIKQTAANSIFILSAENEYRLVDFDNDYQIIVDLSKDTAIARLAKASSKGEEFLQQMNDYIQKTGDFWDNIRDSFSRIASLVEEVIEEVDTRWVANKKQLHQLDDAIEWLDQQSYKDKKYWKDLSKKWIKEREKLNKNIAQNTAISNWLRKNLSPNGLRVGKLGGGIFALVDVGLVINSAINDFNRIAAIYTSVPDPCEDDQAKADNLRGKISRTGIGAGLYYTAQLASDVIQIASLFGGVSAIVPSGGSSITLVAGSVGLAVANFVACKGYEWAFNNRMNSHYREALSLKCLKDCGKPGNPPCPNDPTGNDNGGNGGGNGGGNKPGGGAHQSGSTSDGVEIDPSGYVFEAVPENRVEGVEATIYYKETKEDMYGDPYEEVILWDAEEYAQENPLFTDEFGMYQWDVPQGLWQVRFVKDGYVTAYSEWLPVPPPQLEVNIGIVQNKQPEVTEARAYEDGVEVQFDKYMDLSTLTPDNIYVTANGDKLTGEITFIDSALADEYAEEEDSDALRYASRVRFVPEEPLSVNTGELRLTVSRNVLSYAGIPMTETFTQVLDIEKEVKAIAAEDVKVLYGGEKEVTICAVPFEAAVGRTLHITSSSDLIMSIDKTETVLDAEGKATIVVKGSLPGRAQLSFSIDGVTVTGECEVDVVTEITTAEAPKASRASGTAVYRGTEIELTTDSKDGVIYYTTDGSCPCDENGTRMEYTAPIVINEDTRILAITTLPSEDKEDSEVVEFNYTIRRSDMDFAMEEGWTWISHNFESPVATATIMGDENVQRILSQTQEVVRDPQLGIVGNLEAMDATGSYKVEASASTARQRLSDVAWNPSTPIQLNAGWNWLGYPVAQTMTVEEALAPTEADNLDLIVGQDGFAQFDGESWIGTLETLVPGRGYMYQSATPKEVVYNTSVVSTAAARHAAGINRMSPLTVDIHKYPSVMPVIATLMNLEGENLDNEDYQVNAFCGTECRGIGKIVKGMVMISVYGNAADKITFQVTDSEGTIQLVNNSEVTFSEDLLGNLYDPFVITVDNVNGVKEVSYDGNVKVFTEGGMLMIKGIAPETIEEVEIFDIDGHKFMHETHVTESGIRISHLATGVYVVVVKGNGEYTYHKVSLR